MRADCIVAFLPLDQLIATEVEPAGPDVVGYAISGGCLFPVIDLARRLDLRSVHRGRTPSVVVVELLRGEERRLTGFIADVVADVITVRARDVRGDLLHTPGRPRRLIDPDEFLRWG